MTGSVCVSAMQAGKANYAAPGLKIFGLFTELTAAGSGLSGENTGSNNRNRKP
jgi:hypothetical protein